MDIESCYQLGYVVKKHGLKGDVSILLDVDYPEDYTALESVFLERNQKLIPFFIESIQVNGNRAIVKFEDVDHIDQSEELKGAGLYLPLDQLPSLEEGQFYFHEVIGYTAVDINVGILGEIENIYNFPNQDLIAIRHKGKEVLVPVSDALIIGVNHQQQEMSVDLPDGLIDVYLE